MPLISLSANLYLQTTILIVYKIINNTIITEFLYIKSFCIDNEAE